MTPYEALKEKDLENIKNYIKDYGFMYDSQDDLLSPMEMILSEWNKNKEFLYKVLGEQLTVKRPYTFTIPEEGIVYNFKNNVKNGGSYAAFKNVWLYKIVTKENIKTLTYYNKETKQFDREFPYWDTELKFELSCCTDAEKLAKNTWISKEYKLKFEDGEVFKLSTGMKLMKVFHKFVEKFDPIYLDLFEQFRIWHSQILNNKYLDGEICLSIHPLDFMTMSDNDNGWKSCMRWKGDGRGDVGDYRAGTLECMNSPRIIVAYLHNPEHQMKLGEVWNSEEEKWENTYWNSKKWRELFIIDDEGIIINEIKAYPYQDENLTNTILMWIKELTEKNIGFTYDNIEVDVSKTSIQDDETHSNILVDFSTEEFMYKDIGTLDKHRGRINKKKLVDYVMKNYLEDYNYYESIDEKGEKWKNYTVDIPYGGLAYCMCCGNEVVDTSERVICSRCDAGYVCACCGSTIYNRNAMYYMDDIGEYICEECYNWETGTDEISEDSYMNYNLISLYWKPGKDYINSRPWNKNYEEYFDNTLTIYNGYNSCYFSVFNSTPHYDKVANIYYVTNDQIIDKEAFAELFGLESYEMKTYLGLKI